jgi:hypothetical protein
MFIELILLIENWKWEPYREEIIYFCLSVFCLIVLLQNNYIQYLKIITKAFGDVEHGKYENSILQ